MRTTLVVLLVALAALTGCASSVQGTPHPLDPAANFAERERVGFATIRALMPGASVAEARAFADAMCKGLDDENLSMGTLVWIAMNNKHEPLTESEARTAIGAATYARCIYHG
jgi:hypothetical protein